MSDPVLLAAILAVILLATIVRSALGFGEALIAVPLLALLIPIDTAAPLAALVSITVAIFILAQDWSDVHVGSAMRLVTATLFGIPLGLLLLTRVHEVAVKAILGAVIVAFSSFVLASRKPPALTSERWAPLFGFVAGILGGAYGMNGPPLVLYGTMRGWSPRHFRATLQGYFLPASVVIIGGYAVTGLWTPTVTRLYLLSIPVVIVAVAIGRRVNRSIAATRFVRVVHSGLIAVGIVLLAQALVG